MLAVIQTGGKQYEVKEGSFVSVEKLPQNAGDQVEIKDVLLINDGKSVKVGTPFIEGAVVTASIVEQKKRKTVLIFKKRRRKNHRRKNGHRQPVTIIKIDNIKH